MKIAVFLRGHKRVWEYTKHNIIDFCNGLSTHVDYYVAVWGNQTYDVSPMQFDFPESQLKAFLTVPNDTKYGAFTGPAYLSSLLSPYRLMEELSSGKEYDLIIDTRFDVKFKKLQEISLIEPMSLGSTIVDRDMHGMLEMEDHCFVADRLSHTIWNSRLFQPSNYVVGSHHWMVKYANSYKLPLFNIPWFKCYIVRPHIADVDIEELHQRYYELDGPWHDMSTKERVDIISRIGCHESEYSHHVR